MKTLIEASGLEYQPKLAEHSNGYATVYGSEVKEFETFEQALFDFNKICFHAASLSGILDVED
jgi:hypothetical protein